ncbi:MAG TPA: creatininase family protein [Pseudonocardiaceae bacterium]|jgi:creatinine amidohydrolase
MRFADLSRTELGRLADRALVVLPVGACEQHGPHLPSGTDHIIVERIAMSAAERAARCPVLVAPTVAIGFSEHHMRYGATISVSLDTLRRYLVECCESLIRSGFRRIFLLNGHGGNVDVIGDAAREVSLATGVPIASGSYWVIAWDALVALKAPENGLLPGHAGAFETALAAAVRPDWVVPDPPARPWRAAGRTRGFYPPYRVDDPAVWQRNDGYTDSPAGADPATGTRYLEAIVAAVALAFQEFHLASGGSCD